MTETIDDDPASILAFTHHPLSLALTLGATRSLVSVRQMLGLVGQRGRAPFEQITVASARQVGFPQHDRVILNVVSAPAHYTHITSPSHPRKYYRHPARYLSRVQNSA
jgi:hypothetical protein